MIEAHVLRVLLLKVMGPDDIVRKENMPKEVMPH